MAILNKTSVLRASYGHHWSPESQTPASTSTALPLSATLRRLLTFLRAPLPKLSITIIPLQEESFKTQILVSLIFFCDNSGALVVEAQANIPLKELNFYDLNQSLQEKLVSISTNFPMQIQVTKYTCGGISITFTFDHALGDANAFGKFLVSWSEIARKKLMSCLPDHRRNLDAHFPPTYHPSLDQNFVKCTIDEIINMPTTRIRLKRLYQIDASSIDRLQKLACDDGNKRTKIEDHFSAACQPTERT
jgi:hypothetical protein